MLSGRMIRQYRLSKHIVIEPFIEENLQPNSYDITLGEYSYGFYHDINMSGWNDLKDLKTLFKRNVNRYKGCITIRSGQRILCHTEEFFGASSMVIPKLATRSTIARMGLDICGSAGFGDIGYINRWTLELQNNSPFDYHLPVGTRVGQVYFEELQGDYLRYDGEYNLNPDEYTHEAMLEKWKPESMLPKQL